MNRRRARGLAVVCALALGSLACSSGEHFDAARAGIQKFRDQVAQSQHAEIYAQAEPEIKNSISGEDFGKFLSGLNSKLGGVTSSKQIGWHVNYGTNGAIVTLKYQTEFEKGPGTEEFVFRIKKNVAYLVGYHVNSNTLVADPDVV